MVGLYFSSCTVKCLTARFNSSKIRLLQSIYSKNSLIRILRNPESSTFRTIFSVPIHSFLSLCKNNLRNPEPPHSGNRTISSVPNCHFKHNLNSIIRTCIPPNFSFEVIKCPRLIMARSLFAVIDVHS